MTTAALMLLMAAGASWLLTGAVRRYALKKSMLDLPNQRGSHRRPTPRGGGLALVLVFWAGCLALHLGGHLEARLLGAVSLGLAVAAVGWLDDVKGMRAGVRLTVHGLAALGLAALYPPPPALPFGPLTWSWGWGGLLVAFLGVVWLINSFNFMDGIDGLAGGEALTLALSGALLLPAGQLAGPLILLAGAALGFLVWNRPPARIFMGDVSSGFLGYAAALFWLASASAHPAALWWWPLLAGVFLVDATLTLLWRWRRGEKLSQAHRSHSYQYAAVRFGHLRTTGAALLINVFYLLPLAWVADRLVPPPYAGPVCLAGLVPLILLWLKIRKWGPGH